MVRAIPGHLEDRFCVRTKSDGASHLQIRAFSCRRSIFSVNRRETAHTLSVPYLLELEVGEIFVLAKKNGPRGVIHTGSARLDSCGDPVAFGLRLAHAALVRRVWADSHHDDRLQRPTGMEV